MFKRNFILFLFLSTCLYNAKSQDTFYPNGNNFSSESDSYILHTVEQGQTVYSISKIYNVSIESIYRLNPGSEQVILSGSQLKIPQSKQQQCTYHVILPKETMYSVSKMYNIKEEDLAEANPGLSVQTFYIGKIIKIPLRSTDNVVPTYDVPKEERTNNTFKPPVINTVNAVNVAVLLPFSVKENNLQLKMVEYYEGFLLALDSLKRKGISINVLVKDIGIDTKYLKQILQTDDLKKMNLIIGGFVDEQIKLLSDFSYLHEIPCIVPFASKCDEILKNPFLFQINAPAGFLYVKASKVFLSKYRNYNIIFLQEDNSDRADFVYTLKSDLAMENIPYSTIDYSGKIIPDMQSILTVNKPNVIIPSSGKQEFLMKILPVLATIKQKQGCKLSLFGYPEWQTHDLGDLAGNLYDLNTTIYANFYMKQSSSEARDFYKKFYRWYSRPISNSFPKYSALGFDTGMFFIQVVNKFGTTFDANINNFRYEGIQTNFHYQRISNWSGFVNANVFFVNFNADFSVTREAK